MLHLLDESLEAFLRATVPLGKREVDVSFAAPDRDWAARVSRPTVNLYLWDVRRNLDERDGGQETVRDGNGRPMRRPPLPRVDCRYLVTAWTSEVQDEHYLQGSFARVRPIPTIEVAGSDGRDNSDFWSALGGQLKPGLDVVVTATVDAAMLVAAGPPVYRYSLGTRRIDSGARVSERRFVVGRSREAKDTRVVTRRGAGRVQESGAIDLPGR